jgi:hypothetical protein
MSTMIRCTIHEYKRIHPHGLRRYHNWVALSKGVFKIQKINDEGVEGTPLIIVEDGVEGISDTFIYKSILMVG